MTPPNDPHDTSTARTSSSAAVSVCADKPPVAGVTLHPLRKRSDFLRAARARRVSTPAFTLQARQRGSAEDTAAIRVGFTCSRKVGNAVARNRAKRRLREIARLSLPDHGRAGWDYVLIGRPGVTASRSFAAMRADLARALAQLPRHEAMP